MATAMAAERPTKKPQQMLVRVIHVLLRLPLLLLLLYLLHQYVCVCMYVCVSDGGNSKPPCGSQQPKFNREGLTVYVTYPDDLEHIPGNGQKKQVR